MHEVLFEVIKFKRIFLNIWWNCIFFIWVVFLNVNSSWLQIYSRERNGITISCGIAPDSIVIESCSQVGKGSLHERGCDLTGKERDNKTVKRIAWELHCRLIAKMGIHLTPYNSNSLFTYKMPLAVKFRAQALSWGFGPPLLGHSSSALRTLSRDLFLLCQGLLLSSRSCSWSLPELCCRYAYAPSCTSLILMVILTQTRPIATDVPDSLNSWQDLVTITGPALYALLGSWGTAPLLPRAQLCLPCCDFGLPTHFPLQNSLPSLLLKIIFLFVDGCIKVAKTAKQKYSAGGNFKCMYYKVYFSFSV